LIGRVGKAKRAHVSLSTDFRKRVGTALARFCRPYDPAIGGYA